MFTAHRSLFPLMRLSLAIAYFALMTHGANAAPLIVDQVHELTEFISQGAIGGPPLDHNVAQTVRVGVTGQLIQIDLWVYRRGGEVGPPLVFDIRLTESDGSPREDDATALAKLNIPRSLLINLDSILIDPPPVEPFLFSLDLSAFGLFFSEGDLFAFNLGSDNFLGAALGNFGPGGSAGPYADGEAFLRRTDLMNGEFFPWTGGSALVGPVDLV